MTNKKKMLLSIILLEGFVYGGRTYLFHIDFAKHYIVLLHYIFQFIFSRYREDNHLIWEEMKMIIQANEMLFLVQVLFNDVLQTEYFRFGYAHCAYHRFQYYFKSNDACNIQHVADRVLVIGIGKHANDFVKITRENRFAMMNVLACVDINHVEGFENYHQACRVEDVRGC